MSSDLTRVLVIAGFVVTGLAFLLLNSGPPPVSLNGELTQLTTVSTPKGVAVPLEESAQLFGAVVDPGRLGGYVVEWGKTGSFYLPEERLVKSGGRVFVPLETLVNNLDGQLFRRNGHLDVNLPPAKLLTLSVERDVINLNFDKLSAFERLDSGEHDLRIKFYNASDVSGFNGSRNVESGLVERVTLEADGLDQLILSVDLKPEVRALVATERGGSGFLFQLNLLFDGETEPPGSEVSPAGPQNFSYNTMTRWLDGRRHVIHYLEISDWNDNYRLTPVLANDKVGYGDTLTEMVKDNLGVAGLNANFFDPKTLTPIGLVVKDGKLVSRDWESRAAVGISYFGELEFFRPDLDLYLKTGAGNIPINGFNRPVGSDDLVVYNSRYGRISQQRAPGQVVLTLEGGEVVGRKDRAPSTIGSEQVVVIAAGKGLSKITGLSVGDEAEFKWELEPYVPMLRSAVSAGPLLVKDGKTALDIDRENFNSTDGLVTSRSNRTVMATTSDGDLLFIVVANSGVSLTDLPRLLNSTGLNIRDAIAFDGGSSSGLVYRDGIRIETIGGSRQIPVGLVLVPRS
ncbi:phosphodiester glycosidase family protein [Candidatus Bipolaricaulota bacterium]|nr:phosphodiester glycosidase family protein [Candidatus Bipolaricaulota bacterium]